jgi:hypothetical protein
MSNRKNAIAFVGKTQMTSLASRLSQGFAALAATAFAGIALAQAPAAAPGAAAPATAATAAADGACTECGVVKSVTAIENKARPAGRSAGARAYAGNKIEAKHTVKQYWSVVVMMDDGSTRKLTYKSKPQFREGDRVSMDNPGHHVTRVAD